MNENVLRAGLFILFVSMASPAFAYLDGATGSMLLQAAIGGAATVMVVGRSYIARTRMLVARGFSKIRRAAGPK